MHTIDFIRHKILYIPKYADPQKASVDDWSFTLAEHRSTSPVLDLATVRAWFSNPPKHATKKVILQIKTKSKKTNRQSDQGRTSTSNKLNGNSLLMDSNDTLHSDKF